MQAIQAWNIKLNQGGIHPESADKFTGKIDEKSTERETETESDEKVIQKEGNNSHRKRKKIKWFWIATAVVLGTLVFLYIKKNTARKQLEVDLDEGVLGYPEEGTHTYKKGETVKYEYQLKPGYKDLKIKLNDREILSAGTFLMEQDTQLKVYAAPIGTHTYVQVLCQVTFRGENLRVNHQVRAEGKSMILEEFRFTKHYNPNDDCEDMQKIKRQFIIHRQLGSFVITQEADEEWSIIYPGEESLIGTTLYELEIVNYSFEGGEDPGKPLLSVKQFTFSVSPIELAPQNGWSRLKTREIYIYPNAD
jgi:hypothetical protein